MQRIKEGHIMVPNRVEAGSIKPNISVKVLELLPDVLISFQSDGRSKM